METTYITGYWKINENVKHSYKYHYKKLLGKTLTLLKDQRIIFFYDNDEVLCDVKKVIQTKDIIYKKVSIELLETYKISKDYLETCKLQNNDELRKINNVNEKGLVHFSREYKRSGEISFRKVFTVWTSKLCLVDKIIDENPFDTNYFAWIDISVSRFSIPTKYFLQDYLPNHIYHFDINCMKYYGERLPIIACFLVGHKNIWKKLVPLYKAKLDSLKDSKYGHDEETILYLVWKEHKYLFCDIDKYYGSNFQAAREFVEMKIKHNCESLSGPGSYLKNTTETVSLINQTIKKYNIKTILDLGCGDWNWFKTINMEDIISYVGWDSHNGMIESNRKQYGNPRIKFDIKDIVLEEYPKVDLIICRDVLFHMDINISQLCIDKIKKSCKYLISTSFNGNLKNSNIKSYCYVKNWGFHTINLNIEPFHLEKYIIKSVEEKNNSSNNLRRYINLYKFM